MAETSYDHQVLLEEKSWLESPSTLIALLVVLILAIGGIMGYFWIETKKAEKLEAAQAAYDQAASPEDKLAVAKAHPDAVTSAAWFVDLGNTFYVQEKYDLSAEAFGLVLKNQPDSPLAPGALLGQAEALLASNKSTEAVPLINQLLALKKKNAYQPLARLVLANWQISQNKNSEARHTLEDLQAQSTGSFSQQAAALLATLPE